MDEFSSHSMLEYLYKPICKFTEIQKQKGILRFCTI